MSESITHLYRRVDEDKEYCFNIAITEPLSPGERDCLRLILADGFLIETVSDQPSLTGERVVEVGPRLNFATAWSSNLVSICQATGLKKVERVERSRRFMVPVGDDLDIFVERSHDRMTECQYFEPLTTFETGVVPEPVYEVDLKSKGPNGLLDIPGISMDEFDRDLY
ncbi:MAG: phosphoribosylformylglycinamidine synthase, partial [Desulfobulbaceae bacterium]